MEKKDFSNLLKETRMLDFSSAAIQRLIASRGWKNLGEAERAKAAYDFVRDEILFGYNIDDNISATGNATPKERFLWRCFARLPCLAACTGL